MPAPSSSHLRVARPCSDLARAESMYGPGLGWQVLGRFRDHDGFDGVMLGEPGGAYHVEFTRSCRHPVGPKPTTEDLLVFYLPQQDQWRMRCDAMLAAGFHAVPSFNPYWDRLGRTFEDFDGYRVVLQAAAWSSAAVGEADPG